MSDLILNVAFPAIGASLIAICASIVVREGRTPVTLTNFCAAIALGLAIILWADPHGQAIDRWAHTPGLGWMLVRLFISLGAALHPIAVCLGIGQWDRRRQIVWLPPLLLGLALYVALWNQVHALPFAEDRYFYGLYYHGRPDVVYAMNLARVAVELWYAALGIYAYALLARRSRLPSRWTGMFSSPVFLMAAYAIVGAVGLSSLAQIVTDHAGVHLAWLAPAYLLSFLLAITMFAVVYLRAAVVRPLLRWLGALARAQRQLSELRAATADALDVNSQVDDKLVLITSYADPDIMRATKQKCSAADVTYDERLAVVAAAMIVTLHPDNVDRLRRKGDQQLEEDVRREGLHKLAELSSTDAYFFSDAYMIAALACGAEDAGIALRRAPRPWHRSMAALLRDVLDHYDQPGHYRLAYQQELTRRARERERMRLDLGDARHAATPLHAQGD